jgi:acetylornithine deacetylase/succinyl-diaminopimelate desuccinylase-like protein
LYCAVQCAEKVPHNLTVRATGEGGHASTPHPANAIVRLSRALAAIGAHQEPVRLSEVTRGFLSDLGATWPDRAVGTAMCDVTSDDPEIHARGVKVLADIPSLDAQLRNTAAVTTVSGGTRSNVLPTEAVANLNVRMLPGFPVDDLRARLIRTVDDPHVEITVRSSGRQAPASPVNSEMFETIVQVMHALAPGAPCVPSLSAGATDSAALRLHGMHCYGVLPFPMSQADEDRMHGHDERVSVDSLSFGIAFTCDLVERLCQVPH